MQDLVRGELHRLEVRHDDRPHAARACQNVIVPEQECDVHDERRVITRARKAPTTVEVMIVFGLDRGCAMIVIACQLDRRLTHRILAQHRTARGRRQIQQVGRESDKANDGMGLSRAHDHILDASVYEREGIKASGPTLRWVDDAHASRPTTSRRSGAWGAP